MRKWGWVVGSIVLMAFLGVREMAFAEDVVYLKDGSIIHGTITEEVPGKSIKIETKDGNVFVYKMKAIEKITHTAPTAESNTGAAAAPVVAAAQPTPEPSDPNARFDKFGFFFSGGFWAPGGTNQFNADLEAGTGSTSYDYLPGWFKFGMGLGWYTNNLALKWDFQGTIQPNDYSTDWYYGGTYVGTTTETTYIGYLGTELEGDVGVDFITNKDNVSTLYLPLIVGVWGEEYSISDQYGSATFDGSCTDFGTGVGFRGFDKSNFLWDFQMVYRFSNGNYLTDANNAKIRYVNGKYIYADVAGLDLNFQLGFLFQ